jgi:hypothetical protein
MSLIEQRLCEGDFFLATTWGQLRQLPKSSLVGNAAHGSSVAIVERKLTADEAAGIEGRAFPGNRSQLFREQLSTTDRSQLI